MSDVYTILKTKWMKESKSVKIGKTNIAVSKQTTRLLKGSAQTQMLHSALSEPARHALK